MLENLVLRRVYDSPVLGEWVHRIRRKHKRKIIEQWMIERLNELDFEWKVHQVIHDFTYLHFSLLLSSWMLDGIVYIIM